MLSADIIAKIPVFLGLDEPTIQELQEVVRRVHFSEGKLIFQEGKRARDIYYLESGGVRINMRLPGRHGTVAIIRNGECFGWSALVPPYEFTASAIALEDSDVLMIDGEELRWRMKRHPELAWSVFENLAATISERLAGTRIRLVTLEYAHRQAGGADAPPRAEEDASRVV